MDPWFKSEADAATLIGDVRASENWTLLGKHLATLCSAREQRVRASHNGARVQILKSNEDIEAAHENGRFLIEPPLVARDAALFDNSMKLKGISAVVACREPKTKLGLCPIVALGSGVTTRVQVEEPKNPLKPTCAWFDHALEELGDHVIEQMNKEAKNVRQLDYLLAHLSATPTHFTMYGVAIGLCETLASESV